MTLATIGLTRDARHNYYLDGRGPIMSVTTATSIVDKSGPLIGWAKRITAEAAVDNLADLPKWVNLSGRDGAVDMLKKVASVKRDKAAEMGSEIHGIAEAISRGEPVQVTPEQQPFVDSYLAWRRDFAPEYVYVEEMVASLEHGYAGTFDAIVRLAGETWLIDYKTGGAYPEAALQLVAYGRAEFIGRPGDPQRYAIPPIDRYAVLQIKPEGYQFFPYDVTGAFEAFLAAKRLSEWRRAFVPGAAATAELVKFQEKIA